MLSISAHPQLRQFWMYKVVQFRAPGWGSGKSRYLSNRVFSSTRRQSGNESLGSGIWVLHNSILMALYAFFFSLSLFSLFWFFFGCCFLVLGFFYYYYHPRFVGLNSLISRTLTDLWKDKNLKAWGTSSATKHKNCPPVYGKASLKPASSSSI